VAKPAAIASPTTEAEILRPARGQMTSLCSVFFLID
jgi:hypothetical protein